MRVMKKKDCSTRIIEINACDECPSFYDTTCDCLETDKSTSIETDCHNEIPDWCPLPKAKRRQLSDSKEKTKAIEILLLTMIMYALRVNAKNKFGAKFLNEMENLSKRFSIKIIKTLNEKI